HRADLVAGYRVIVSRIGIGGGGGDLAHRDPLDAEDLPPPPLGPPPAPLLQRHRRNPHRAPRDLRVPPGRSRVATLSRPHDDRPACSSLGRCFWGCPTDAIYSPAVTLAQCQRHPRFRYVPGLLVTHFEASGEGRVRRMLGEELATGE